MNSTKLKLIILIFLISLKFYSQGTAFDIGFRKGFKETCYSQGFGEYENYGDPKKCNRAISNGVYDIDYREGYRCGTLQATEFIEKLKKNNENLKKIKVSERESVNQNTIGAPDHLNVDIYKDVQNNDYEFKKPIDYGHPVSLDIFNNDIIVPQNYYNKSNSELINETIEIKKKSEKNIYTDELIDEKAELKNRISAMAMNLNSTSKFKEASALFYSLYTLDPKQEGKALKNACILSIQAEDYVLAQKLFEEYTTSDYLNNGVTYYAVNKASGSEEEFDSKEHRSQYISLGSHEKPRDVKNATKKADAIKMLAMLYAQNKDVEKAKVTYAEARKLAPNDPELKTGEFQLYYNSGYALLADEEKIVNEINGSRDNPKKYDELVAKRKDMFAKAIPDFEKAYSLDSSNESLKTILKMAYEITGQAEKAKTIN
ncbi:tetratricopeptide repeat protein [Flavobacterium cyclinae]|uniref:tetratricopeptide repeat protein n=1 Tax=Flavobacterium cyclinae TaxID=2895947 RepID=UPI001E336DF0|nr:hypothetical protein [Flavobacterium cyclinae]UGS22239.1 hypothetical protein LOS86_06335 [Flavobacterium cyclinae]